MRYLYIALLSLLVGLSGCTFLAQADENQAQEKESTKSLVKEEKQVDKSQPGEIDMKETIQSYVQGADEQSVELVDKAFHDKFQVVAHTEGSVKVLDKTTYLQLLGAGKIGGTKREIQFLDLHVDDLVGTARVNLVSDKVTFHDHLSLIKEEGSWKIVSNTTYVSPN